MGGNFSNKIFFSNEAHFTLGGYVNKQNCHNCGSENPQVIEERPLQPEEAKRKRRWNDRHRQFGALWP